MKTPKDVSISTINMTTLKTRTGEILDRAKTEAVIVERNGTPAAVIISPEAYAHFEKLEDAYWAALVATRRAEGGYLSNQDSLAAIKMATIITL